MQQAMINGAQGISQMSLDQTLSVWGGSGHETILDQLAIATCMQLNMTYHIPLLQVAIPKGNQHVGTYI